MRLHRIFSAAALALLCAQSYAAGGFIELPTPPADPLRVFGTQNLNVDPLYLAAPNFQLLDSRDTDVIFIGTAEVIGTFHDFVYRDLSDNKLVFGSRLELGNNDAEVNDIFRSGFTGFTAAAAWTFATDNDLRLYSSARTATGLLEGADVFDADVINYRSDVNSSEGNPFSGLYLAKTDAVAYQLLSDVVRLRQAGEEGQDVTQAIFSGFAPAAAVPEPSSWAFLLAGLVARRRFKV